MISSSPIRTKASRLKKILPVNQFEENIFQYNLLAKSTTSSIYCDDCVENIINDYEALVFYLTNGFKPNWLSKETFFDPKSILLFLYTNHANLFVEFIHSIKDDTKLLSRAINLIDKKVFNSNCSFHSEVNSRSAFIEISKDWLLELSSING